MSSLLDKTRRMNRFLQQKAGQAVDFTQVTEVLSEVTESNVYLVDRAGVILGMALFAGNECPIVTEVTDKGRFPAAFNRELLRLEESVPNVQREGEICDFRDDATCIMGSKVDLMVPVVGNGHRLGTLVMSRFGERFTDEDSVVAEYGATVAAMEMLRERGERGEALARKKAAVQVAIGSLSYSELEAVRHVFEELNGMEGFLVASKIADRVGITRSVIVNALRKFESAGVIESRSLGMKGTYIKILNDLLPAELKSV